MGGGCGQRDQLAEGSSRFLSDLGASSFAAVFPALEIFLEGKLGAGGHCGDLSGIKLFRRKNGRKHGGKTAVSLGHLLWNRVFCHSDHRLRSLPARADLPEPEDFCGRQQSVPSAEWQAE